MNSPFARIEAAPPDPILGLTEAFNTDPNPKKVNLGVGVYQDGSGKVPILNVVRKAERKLSETEPSKTYLPIEGPPAFTARVQDLIFGASSPVVTDGRVATIQAPGGTGALRVGADFIRRFYPDAQAWISNPSWENHRALFEAAGFKVNAYPYYDPATHGVDFAAMLSTLRALPPQSLVVLHVCCHNPTGVDLTPDQWKEVASVFTAGDRLPFLDFAYQGFGVGLERDALAVRAFVDAGVPCLVSSSFSKSFSLYRERVGALSIVTPGEEEAKRVLTQVKRVVRTNYSSPPSHGGQVVGIVLNDPDLRAEWEQELAGMRERIHSMRGQFVRLLQSKGVGQDFSFIERQQGMFSYSGLTVEQVQRLRQENSIYIVNSGRICVAALNEQNMDYVCSAIANVL